MAGTLGGRPSSHAASARRGRQRKARRAQLLQRQRKLEGHRRFKDIERLEMLVNFSRETKKKEEKKPQALRRPTLGGRSSLFANNQNQNQAAPAEGLAPTEVKVPSPPLGLVKKRPKRKKRASVVGM